MWVARQILLWAGLWVIGVSVTYWLFRGLIGLPESQAMFYALAGGIGALPAIVIRVIWTGRKARSGNLEIRSDGPKTSRVSRYAIALIYLGAGVALGGVYLVVRGQLVVGSSTTMLGLLLAIVGATRTHKE